jgi:hypothetical protein
VTYGSTARGNNTGTFKTQDVTFARWWRVLAPTLKQIRTIECGGLNVDQYLTFREGGLGHIRNP